MGINVNKIPKEEIYKFSEEVEKFLKMLNGTTIQSNYKNEIYDIEKQKNKLEKLVLNFKPTLYEEYSMKTKRAYQEMIYAKKEFERVVKEKCFESVIDEKKDIYKEKAQTYENTKEYRNKLKEALDEKDSCIH
ncbi:hypothetical protein K5V21_12580 [Clostridium sardiniense]|uniref:Flagellar FliJ protein n=1 Tax=Clostridium sardiniense TaxID=29369 RepID=A0ABS7KZP1_CLOSR|nr:hypothetical protein [Clostridium sardiniense]MBY0756283.1 hypothetical protein [Clostridium sardiniense]MDQ0458502.1 DNA-directed RNA polymerase beta' subunit [Clostridium sardiniense]